MLENQSQKWKNGKSLPDSKSKTDVIPLHWQNFESFFNACSDFFWILDLNGRIVDMNRTVEEKLGYTKKELMGKPVTLVHPKDLEDDVNETVAAILNGEKDICDIPLKTRSGKLIPVQTTIFRGEWNNNAALFGASRDVSDQIMFQKRFVKAFHANPALAAICRSDTGAFIEVNHGFYESLGYLPEELLGKHIGQLTLFDQAIQDKISLAVQKNQRITNDETRAIAKSGRQVPCLLSLQTIPLDQDYIYISILPIESMTGRIDKLTAENKLLAEQLEERTRKLDRETIDRRYVEQEVSHKNILLAEKNIALKQLLDQRENEKQEIREEVSKNIQRLIFPLIDRLKAGGSDTDRIYLNMLINNLKEITTPLQNPVKETMSSLSSRELEICNLISQGCNSSDIAGLLCLSIQTVNTHRKNIRKKLNITNKGVNLATYLKSRD